MEKDLRIVHRSSYFSGRGCMTMMSPSSCLPLHDEFQYSRIHCRNKNLNNNKKGGRWRNLFKRLMREGKTACGCGSKPLSFQYDPVSYSQNFDDGCHLHEPPTRLSLLFHHVSSTGASLDGLESTVKHE